MSSCCLDLNFSIRDTCCPIYSWVKTERLVDRTILQFESLSDLSYVKIAHILEPIYNFTEDRDLRYLPYTRPKLIIPHNVSTAIYMLEGMTNRSFISPYIERNAVIDFYGMDLYPSQNIFPTQIHIINKDNERKNRMVLEALENKFNVSLFHPD